MVVDFISHLSLIEIILGGSMLILILVILIIKFVALFKLHSKCDDRSGIKQPISVVITSQNDAVFLKDNLKYFLQQDYPNYEVIVVDDCSYDDTQTVLAEYQQRYNNLRISTINPDDKFSHTRKFALNIGIKAASNDIILFSEANCRPVSNNWIDYMQSAFKPQIDIVLAYSNYARTFSYKEGFLVYDRFIRELRTLVFALKNKPYRGDGSNMAFRKSAYFKYNCFAGSSQIEAGYDSLPVLKMANEKNVSVVLHSDSHVCIDYIDINKEWNRFKTLYFQSRLFYNHKIKFRIDIVPFLRILVLFIFFVFISVTDYKLIALGVFLLYQILTIVHKKMLLNVLNERKIFVYSIYADLVIGVLSFVQFLKARFSWFYGTKFKFIR